ncbi:MAG: right-handed parallel beta-helix repeat-containing protein [Prosthecobacter sp.]|uniref:right-handed parallel beta-helix repeat-containing protein n=1 Tax=Prosthecobacter sp. TaxID=1965333 RepID=UPI0039042835
MKTTSILRSAFAAATLLLPALAFGQGQLNPPTAVSPYPNERALTPGGIPTPSMKTLMQIDSGEHIPSRDTSNANLNGSLGYYLLAAPGRYYLTENLALRILITSDNVTLDLGGFEVVYPGAGALNAIEAQSGVAGTVIRTKVINGRVRGAWQIGVKLGDDSVVSGVDVSAITNYGIKVGNDSLVHQSRVRGPWTGPQSGGPGMHSGIYAGEASVITSCTATAIAGIGIQGADNVRVSDCTVNYVAGCGIVTSHCGTVAGCSVRTCGVTGFDLNQASTLMNSTATNCGGAGVHIRNACALTNVTSRSNMSHGFLVENIAPPNSPAVPDNATNFIQCVSQSNTGDGFRATSDCSFTHCTAEKNGTPGVLGGLPASGDGFKFTDKCRVTNCVANNNVRDGYFGNTGNTIDQSSAASNGAYGVEVASDQNVVTRNTFRSNTTAPVQPAPANGIAPLQTAFGATNPFANFSL